MSDLRTGLPGEISTFVCLCVEGGVVGVLTASTAITGDVRIPDIPTETHAPPGT